MEQAGSNESVRDQHIDIDYFRPEDAESIAALFRAVYGDGYPIKIYYDPQALTQANADGDQYSMVARNREGVVAGVMHLYRSSPCKLLYELGAVLVLKQYRNQGLNKRLLSFGLQEWVPKQKNIEGVFGESVCNHPYMHKAKIFFGYSPTALEIALMPAEAYDAEKSATGRVATLVGFRTYIPRPHKICLPKDYEQELRFIYSHLNDQRELCIAGGNLPGEILSEIKMEIFDFARVARISVHKSAADLERRLNELEAEALGKGVVVNQIFLNLGEPWIAAAVGMLRDRGYFFGGVFPRWFDQDGLLMQKLHCAPDFEEIKLLSDRSHKLLAMIKQDWSRTSARME
jgi:GNAT superfamily N-acetyltransferase